MRRLILLAIAAVGLIAAGEAPIALPEGFRGWTPVSSAQVGSGNPAAPKYEGLHTIYGNAAAIEGYKTGKWADGAVIILDQWTAEKTGPDASGQGQRKFIDVMVRDSRRYAATGGWGYTEFTWPSRDRVVAIEDNAAKACSGCHAQNAPGGDQVFSVFKD
ncbi:MAG: cytochrome P460 family protein [Alphaproteobacteria bacterium]|nr:cytochrome P460 family protein [Alphaproteobacteria bacterium]MBU1515823.1 cytochrome P460 family protein [Alphaproteobacteria bacterium]MBU2094045.1 cytochrome P460 family protein [Alphaproteobacteria bacterium]MBU2151397.1 cytochrome P460 family protein [Alphaproteobacteria bacterium]MBU2305327.1 cytochrome P460 family protein [Alphaproteobacteria bacterium]